MESLYIDGEFRAGGGETIPVTDPTTEETTAAVPGATPDQVEAALAAASAAQPGWARRPAVERGDALRGLAAVVEDLGDELADLLVEEVGKPLENAADTTGGDNSERRGVLTIKGAPSGGVRPEFEYTIPPADVERMLDRFCGDRRVEKVRHYVQSAGHEWVVDVFEGRNEGLVLA